MGLGALPPHLTACPSTGLLRKSRASPGGKSDLLHYSRVYRTSSENFYKVYLHALNVIISSPWAISDEQVAAATETKFNIKKQEFLDIFASADQADQAEWEEQEEQEEQTYQEALLQYAQSPPYPSRCSYF
ncbi:hypothetical protein BG000_002794 [Podila horticola]|nr:hypothetical protein BG000_002794 [Podila horticola]